MDVAPDRTVQGGAGRQILVGVGAFVVVIGGLFWTITAAADALAGPGGFVGAVAGYALLGGVVTGLLYGRYADAVDVWGDAEVVDRVRDGEGVAVSGALATDGTVTGPEGDDVVGFEYHIYREAGSGGSVSGDDVATGWRGPPLTVEVDGDRVAVDPEDTEVHVDGTGERVPVGFAREGDRVVETSGGATADLVAEHVDDAAFDAFDTNALGDGLNGEFELRYWPLADTEEVYLVGRFEREGPGEPYRPTTDAVVVGNGDAADRRDEAVGRARLLERATYALLAGGLVLAVVAVAL